jgi:hypothetical protein
VLLSLFRRCRASRTLTVDDAPLVTPTVAVMTVVAALSPSQVLYRAQEKRAEEETSVPRPRLAQSMDPCLDRQPLDSHRPLSPFGLVSLPIFPLSTPFALLEVSPAVQLGSCRADNVQIVARPLSSGSCTLSGCP